MRQTTASSSTASERLHDIEQICLRLLARREHSRRELLEKLALRGFGAEEAEPVVAKIIERGWQNDDRYAESFIRQRIENGYGPMRIRYELQQRGVANAQMDTQVEDYAGGWQNLLRDVYQKKFGEESGLSQAEWLKRNRFLRQRGFSAEMIQALFKELKIKVSVKKS